jgi:tryptophanyl-tRNA synthetase
VWAFHQIYSGDDTMQWVQNGCRTAGIGCVDCKQPVIDAVLKEMAPIRERAQDYLNDPKLVQNILNDGSEAAREVAQDTLEEVREAMGLDYD